MIYLYVYNFINRLIIFIFSAFSYSCGYRKVFEEYVNILQQKYPELKIDGENYIPSHNKMFIAKLLVIIFCFYNT